MMQQIVSLTSQGQISIPRKMLRYHKITQSGKVMIVPTKTGWAVEPVADFWSLAGSLHKYAMKGKTADEIMAIEYGAWEKTAVERYKKSIKKAQ